MAPWESNSSVWGTTWRRRCGGSRRAASPPSTATSCARPAPDGSGRKRHIDCTSDPWTGRATLIREKIAMLLRSLILLLVLWAPARSLAAQDGELRLDINIPANRLTVYEGDRVLRTYPVSVGLPGHNTPMGSFKIS